MKKLVPITLATLFASSLFSSATIADTPRKITAAGDSITMAFTAYCSGNVWFWDYSCLLDGDQPTRSWFDGSNNSIDSVHDKYKRLKSSIRLQNNLFDELHSKDVVSLVLMRKGYSVHTLYLVSTADD